MSAALKQAPRSPGPSWQELLDADTRPVPEILRLQSPARLGDQDLSIDRYVDPAFHAREVQKLWSRVWQFACREEHIPEVGDHVVYDVANLSFVVIRTAPKRIQAFVNACLHRGRRLKDHDGSCSELRCPYHGFTWHLDGRFKRAPSHDWDLRHLDPAAFSLPEASVGTWAGFVMLNPDPNAEPLEQFLGDAIPHYARWDLANRYVEVHVAKVIEANWKIAQEAFAEAYHVGATHPQASAYLGDTNSQIDCWENFARSVTAGLTPSPLLAWTPSEEEMLRAQLDVRLDEPLPIAIPPGKTARQVAADNARERWRPTLGAVVDAWTDAELVDNLTYTIFPNFHPWGAVNRIVYRFRPNGDDHRSSIMEVLYLSPFRGERPPPARVRELAADEPWSSAPELGVLAKVFEQDTFNMKQVQRGLETTRKRGVTLTSYQESKVRWLNHKLDQWLARP
jgi:phenylpropionate dioxygenase-like ring-hydroxylating dioxygenase large terminal subunit